MTRLRWTAVLVAAAVLLAGCGEIQNTLKPQPGTANTVTIALDAPANFTQVGIFDAEALGYFAQTDIKLRVITSADPLTAIANGQAQIAISNEPAVLLARNRHVALASVAAILQGPQRIAISCHVPGTTTRTTSAKRSRSGARTSRTATTSAPRAHPPLRAPRCRARVNARPDSRYRQAPTYNALNLVVTEKEIIGQAPLLRRLVQAIGRGYDAVRADPRTATANLVKLNPQLDYSTELTGVRAALADFFPPAASPTTTKTRPWGFQIVDQWNAFGSWLLEQHIISNPNATPDADTNELLAGQGV